MTNTIYNVRYCKDCKHCRPWVSDWILLLPVIGWAIWLTTRLSGDYLKLGKCAVSFNDFKSAELLLAKNIPRETKFMEISREYGPCGRDAKLFEPRK